MTNVFSFTRLAVATALALSVVPLAARAELTLLQPPRLLQGDAPLSLTVLVDHSGRGRRTYHLPDVLKVTVSNDDIKPMALVLRRTSRGSGTITLGPGQFRKVVYAAPLPALFRGIVRVVPENWDAASTTISLDRAAPTQPVAAAEPLAPAGASAATATPTPTTQAAQGQPGPAIPPETPQRALETGLPARITGNEPMYFAVGKNGHTNAKFQLSFKFRLLMPDSPDSRSLLDNLYFGYTQLSTWDLQAESKPFRDSNYRPSLFYYIPDTGWKSRWFTSLGIQTGLEHESNGLAGSESRSINMAFVKPILTFGDPTDYHWTVAPKLYAYLEKGENPDIAQYRGYVDLLVAYGKPNGWQFAAMLRKGTRGGYGSIDAQVTYPLARLIPGTGGYLWFGYFNGYGEDLLDYNRRMHSQFRVGYSVVRW